MAGQAPLDLSATLTDPSAYPPTDQLDKTCDLVMKGGITSGVVYPKTVCQLATDHRIARVGGTSAGAIAAGAAAAAEVGRSAGGFARLAELPDWLAATPADGRHTNLYHLFQPRPATRSYYRLLMAVVGRGSPGKKALNGFAQAARAIRPGVGAVLLIAVPLALLVLSIVQTSAWGIIASALLLLIGILAAAVVSLVRGFEDALDGNLFGLCTGLRDEGSTHPAVTEWLAGELNQLAGRPAAGEPLTFGHLAEQDVELAMLTSNVSTMTQVRIPFAQRIWAFDPEEFRRLFPESVVTWMIENPPEPRGTPSEQQRDREVFDGYVAAGLRPMPDHENLPVIVGVRMSLSFPVLLSAVPLHAFDWLTDADDPPVVRHWFSDGGATSNFPLHFFDNPVPHHATFGINLSEIPDDDLAADECANVSMPSSNREGITARPIAIHDFMGFAGALKNVVQNWADTMQTHMPGYRDRVVAVNHTSTEGGLNLDMDPQVVEALSERGRCAGATVQQHFDIDNHRWVRYRSFLSVLEQVVRPAADNYRASAVWADRSYAEMITDPPSYRTGWHEAEGANVSQAILHLADAYAAAEATRTTVRDGKVSTKTFADGAPHPAPQLQTRPHV